MDRRADAIARGTASRLRPLRAVVALLAFSGCAGVFGLDDLEDVSVVFCDLLGRCYADRGSGQCQVHVGGGLEEGSPNARGAWLRAFADNSCLETCTSARRCLDMVPVCDSAACSVKEDCCGFVSGRSDCDIGSGTCCRRQGVACTSDDDCCPGAGLCSSLTHTCGGVICSTAGAACLNDFECCTGRCDDLRCAETICGEDGFECDEDADCCGGHCAPETGTCGFPGCEPLGQPCGDASPCCEELVCHLGICSDAECFPLGGDCVTDMQCCSGYCDPTYYLCGIACKEDGAECVDPAECCGGGCDGTCFTECSTGECVENTDCCSGNCVTGVCAPVCATKACSHSACDVGGPLDASCDACAAEVCAIDAYCCCTAWDSLCVTEAVATCGGVCG